MHNHASPNPLAMPQDGSGTDVRGRVSDWGSPLAPRSEPSVDGNAYLRPLRSSGGSAASILMPGADDIDVNHIWCGRVVQCFIAPTDDRATVQLKTFLFRFMLAMSFCTLFVFGLFAKQVALYTAFALGVLYLACIPSSILVMLVTNTVTHTTLSLVVILSSLCFFFVEVYAVDRLGYPRYWPLFLVCFSTNMVFNVSQRIQTFTYCVAALSLVLSAVQQVGRWDLSWGNTSTHVPLVCDCEDPPCSIPPQNNVLFLTTGVITLYFCTTIMRGFSRRVEQQQRKLLSAIDVAESIATCLSAFDLSAAEELLAGATRETGHDLPPKLRAALEHILRNLKLYRPYLPDELFPLDGSCPSELSSPVGSDPRPSIPGSAVKHAAIVFTDIRQSTALWEHSGDAMREALTLHNTIVRTAIAAWSGYEVKTIGDAFMVAFHDARDAVRFGVDVQTRIGEAQWPSGLTRPSGDDKFPLLCLRIGVHAGPVTVERNTLTGRYDYFGPTVNAAARVEAHGIPGAVTITEAVKECEGLREDLEEMVVMPYTEARYGRGLGDALWLTAVVGRDTARERVAHVQELCAARAEQPGRKALSPVSVGMRSSPCPSIVDTGSTPDTSYTDMSMPVSNRPLSRGNAVWTRTVRAAATVGVVKFAFWTDDESSWALAEDFIALRLQELHTHLRTTNGHVSTLLHNVVLVSWGVYGRCSQHMNESVRFLMLLEEGFRGGPRGRSGCGFHAGLATGPVASGQVSASSSQRLLTMLGPCVDLGLMLCGGAAEVGVVALVASVADVDMDRYECNALLRDHLRLVDRWDISAARREVSVYELRLGSLRVTMGAKVVPRRRRSQPGSAHDRSDVVEAESETRTVSPTLTHVNANLQHALGRWIEPQRHLLLGSQMSAPRGSIEESQISV